MHAAAIEQQRQLVEYRVEYGRRLIEAEIVDRALVGGRLLAMVVRDILDELELPEVTRGLQRGQVELVRALTAVRISAYEVVRCRIGIDGPVIVRIVRHPALIIEAGPHPPGIA